MISNEHLFHRCHFFRLYAIILIDARRFSNDSNRRLKWTSPIYYFGQVAWISQPLSKERVQKILYYFIENCPEKYLCEMHGWKRYDETNFQMSSPKISWFILFESIFFFHILLNIKLCHQLVNHSWRQKGGNLTFEISKQSEHF